MDLSALKDGQLNEVGLGLNLQLETEPFQLDIPATCGVIQTNRTIGSTTSGIRHLTQWRSTEWDWCSWIAWRTLRSVA